MKGLRAIRERKGLTLQQVEDLTGIDGNTISRYERGVLNPTSKTVLKISEGLGVTVDELLNGPVENRITIELVFEKPKEEMIDMSNANGKFKLFLGDDGEVGISGGAKFASKEDIKTWASDLIKQLEFGFDCQVQRGALIGV